MSRYGQKALLEVQLGEVLPDGNVEVFVPIAGTDFNRHIMGDVYWQCILCPQDKIVKNKVEFIIVDNDFDDEHTSLLCPDMQTVISVHDVNIKIPFFKNLIHKLRGKRLKISEV